MKKTHIQYRSGLLIGLLSLSISSSCAHTRQRLGLNDASREQEGQNHNSDSSPESNTGQEPSMNPTFSSQEEQGNNRNNLEMASRSNWIPTPVRSIVTSLIITMQPWDPLWAMECLAIGFGVGYAIGHTPDCLRESLSFYSAYPGH